MTSDAAVTAALSAPSVGSVLPFDAGLLASLTAPTAPAAVRGDVLADGAAALADVQADKSDFQAAAQQFVADVAGENLDLQAGLTQARTDLLDDNATAAETQAAAGGRRHRHALLLRALAAKR